VSRYQKHVDITEQLLAQIQKLAGADVSAADIVVFEATAAGTRPIKQLGSMYDGAVITRATLEEMAAKLNSGEESVPLHTMHNARQELPVGRVFQGQVIATPDGEYELRVYFYLPKTEAQLIENINLGVLDEVSVGFLSRSAMCSSCGHDYFSPEADLMDLFTRTCPNGHVLGVDGVHLNLAGVDTWSETSLVPRGASSRAKIHGQARQTSTNFERLAASGVSAQAIFLSATPQHSEEPPVANDTLLAELSAGLTEVKAKLVELAAVPAALTQAQADLAAAETALTASQAEVATKDSQIAELQAKVDAGVQSALQGNLPTGGVSTGTLTDTQPAAPTVSAAFRSPTRV
jgi:hypothetical protein